MENLFQNVQVDQIFDLKGSSQGRTRLKNNQKPLDLKGQNIALKDNDFIKHMKGGLTFVENRQDEFGNKKRKIKEIIRTDTEFLMEQQLIDYSLLLGQLADNRE